MRDISGTSLVIRELQKRSNTGISGRTQNSRKCRLLPSFLSSAALFLTFAQEWSWQKWHPRDARGLSGDDEGNHGRGSNLWKAQTTDNLWSHPLSGALFLHIRSSQNRRRRISFIAKTTTTPGRACPAGDAKLARAKFFRQGARSESLERARSFHAVVGGVTENIVYSRCFSLVKRRSIEAKESAHIQRTSDRKSR